MIQEVCSDYCDVGRRAQILSEDDEIIAHSCRRRHDNRLGTQSQCGARELMAKCIIAIVEQIVGYDA